MAQECVCFDGKGKTWGRIAEPVGDGPLDGKRASDDIGKMWLAILPAFSAASFHIPLFTLFIRFI